MRVLFVCLALAAGCHGDDDDIIQRDWPDLAVRLYDLAGAPGDGGATSGLGSGRERPAPSTPLRVGANQSVTVPDGEYGFTATANGRGGWRVAWVDAAQLGFRFHASVFGDATLTDLQSTGMSYALVDASRTRIDFESAPGAGQVGWVDFSATGPITVDGLVGANPGTLYYPSSAGITLTAATPASFSSP